MKSFTDLQAWQTGMRLVREIYAITKIFPSSEKFAMVSQMRRSVTGILANSAEGFSRRTSADKAHKYTIARGECSETEAFLHIAIALGFLDKQAANEALSLCSQTGKLLSGLVHAHSPTPNAPLPTP